jgi:4-hydroxy 2-oxovalerate aldolase
MNIKILDCTLRDGGYINEFEFGYTAVKNTIAKLTQSSIEIVECGFLVSGAENKDKTLFSGIEAIKDVIGQKNNHVMYVAMIQYGAIPIEEITPYDGSSVDGIRLTFHEHDIQGALETGKDLMEKGYKVFMQPVGTNTYTDKSLLLLIDKINDMRPFAFYLVDTLGSMYKKDLLRMFYLVDHNLDKKITIGFHSHNNLQLSFSNAQELILLNREREMILDTSVFGMGRGAGNLCTELLMQYINENITQKYDVVPILEIIDTYIYPIYTKHFWGYSVPYYIASVHKCHPNYANYLINKQTITVKDIHSIIKTLDVNKRTLYDEKYITEMYLSYQKHYIDDSESLKKIKSICGDKEVLVLAPGNSLVKESDTIEKYIEINKPVVVSVNFIPDTVKVDFAFVSNLRRFANFDELYTRNKVKIVCTSNINIKRDDDLITVNYAGYLNAEPLIFDNAGLMLLNLLHKTGIERIMLAGFDGFSLDRKNNYFTERLKNIADDEQLLEMNKSISEKLNKLRQFMHIDFLTETIYRQDKHEEV